MSTVYIVTDVGKLQKRNHALHLWYGDGTTSTIFPFKTEQLVIIGNIEITSQALKILMHNQIDTVFLNKNGKFCGRLAFQDSKNVYLRRTQYKLLDNEEFKLKFAKSIVDGKLRNQLTFMHRISRGLENNFEFVDTIGKMKLNIQNLENAENLDQVRGYEGIGAKYYFSIFRHNLKQDWAIFESRSMNPPESNVNAVLSFIYTLINYRVEAAIETEGLDSFVGYLHSLDYGRRSLIFDLMEEYRTPIADTITCALFNLGILNKEDFREVSFANNDDEYPLDMESEAKDDENIAIKTNKGILLTQDGITKVIKQFEKKLDEKYYYQPAGQSISFRQIIREQIKHFKRVINGEEITYKPLIIK